MLQTTEAEYGGHRASSLATDGAIDRVGAGAIRMAENYHGGLAVLFHQFGYPRDRTQRDR
ncbi:hypothetical protein D3C77_716330 [compost metagenome]